jgi:hypothetical protein
MVFNWARSMYILEPVSALIFNSTQSVQLRKTKPVQFSYAAPPAELTLVPDTGQKNTRHIGRV